MFFWFLGALFRFVARFARVRIEDSSFNRFASTAYFAKPGFVGVKFSGGKQPGWNLPGGIFRGGICRSPLFYIFLNQFLLKGASFIRKISFKVELKKKRYEKAIGTTFAPVNLFNIAVVSGYCSFEWLVKY